MIDWTNFVGEHETAAEVPSDYLIERIKNWRRGELLSTDFTQLADAQGDKAAFATYRQGLRDLPEQGADPRAWIFPVKP